MFEKFPGFDVEMQRQELRWEEVFEKARSCPVCLRQREAEEDDEALCAEHMTELYGIRRPGKS